MKIERPPGVKMLRLALPTNQYKHPEPFTQMPQTYFLQKILVAAYG